MGWDVAVKTKTCDYSVAYLKSWMKKASRHHATQRNKTIYNHLMEIRDCIHNPEIFDKACDFYLNLIWWGKVKKNSYLAIAISLALTYCLGFGYMLWLGVH